MSTDEQDSNVIAGFWVCACQSAQSYAASIAMQCSQPFRDLIMEEARSLTSQRSPTSFTEMQNLNAQNIQFLAKVGSICHANGMARMVPEVASEILAATRAFCDANVLTSDCNVSSTSLLNQISTLCQTACTHRMFGR